MEYNFDERIERKGTVSIKWDYLNEIFGSDDLTSMWVADMDFRSPVPVVDAIVERAKHGVYGYTGKDEVFFQAVINWMKNKHSVETKKEWYIPTPGVLAGISAAINTFTQPGDEIIVQTPVYYPFFSSIESNGRRLVKNPLKLEETRYLMDLDDFEQKITNKTTMLILSNPHNPVGRVWEEDTLKKLGEICKRNDIFIISDEIHADLVFGKHEHHSFLNLEDFQSHSMVFIAPSKTFNLAGLVSASAIIPDEQIRRRFQNKIDAWHIGMLNLFGVIGFQTAYQYGKEWYEQMMTYVWDNYKFMCEFVENRIPSLKVFPLEGTYLAWVDFRGLNLSHEKINELCLNKAKLALDEGMMFGYEGSGFQRFNIACPRSILKEALEKLEQEIKKLA
ncbi:MAG: MalY/PatB family protein [Thermotogota bacterium]|nr:MalY/PatB family protein [Thermotogota bacterium]